MGIGSGRTRVADLRFQVFGRTIHPEWFATRGFRRYVQTGWEADVRIIEGGHAVLWCCGSIRIAEVLAPAGGTWPEPGPLFRSALRQERSTSLRPEPGIEYQTCFAVERMEPEVFAHLDAELSLDPERNGLFHRFEAGTRLSAAPLTRLQVEARPRYLSVQSFHTLPDERAVVRIQSLFEIRRPIPG